MLCKCSWYHTVKGIMTKTLCRHKFVLLRMFSPPSPPPVGMGAEGLGRSGPRLLMWVRTFRNPEPCLTFLHISPTFTTRLNNEHSVNFCQTEKMMQSQREVHFALRPTFYKEKWTKKACKTWVNLTWFLCRNFQCGNACKSNTKSTSST